MTSRRQFFQVSALLGTAGLLASPRRAVAAARWSNITYGQPATDVAIGSDGSYWMLGTDAKPGGYGIYRLESGHDWQPDRAAASSAGVRIAVDPNGQPWVVTAGNEIWRRTSDTTWRQMPGAATDIGIGADGTVWILGTDVKPGGYGLWRWTGATWVPDEVSGSAGVRISVDRRGQPWVVNSAAEIWYRSGAPGWSKLPGSATEIGLGANGSVWMLGTNAKAGGYGLWEWNGISWKEDSVSAESAGLQIAVSDTGTVVVVNNAAELWELDGWR